jgi:hypothetical protein
VKYKISDTRLQQGLHIFSIHAMSQLCKNYFCSYTQCLHFSAMSSLTKSMCWKMVVKTKDKLNQVGMAIYQKPMDNRCYEKRSENNPPLCKETDDADAAWYDLCSLSRLHICNCTGKLSAFPFDMQECIFGSMHAQIACGVISPRIKMARIMATEA